MRSAVRVSGHVSRHATTYYIFVRDALGVYILSAAAVRSGLIDCVSDGEKASWWMFELDGRNRKGLPVRVYK